MGWTASFSLSMLVGIKIPRLHCQRFDSEVWSGAQESELWDSSSDNPDHQLDLETRGLDRSPELTVGVTSSTSQL